MKKLRLLIVLFIAVVFVTACGSSGGSSNKQERTAEDLFDAYVEAYTTANLKLAKTLFPEFYSKSLTQEMLDSGLKSAKEEYGDDFTITYVIDKKVKATDEELEELNTTLTRYFETDEKALECYKLEGTITFKGSKFEDPDPLSEVAYCRYSDGWYLIGA